MEYWESTSARVDRLERVVVGMYCALVAVILIVAFFTPFAVTGPGTDDEKSLSLSTAWRWGTPEKQLEWVLVIGMAATAVAVISHVLLILPAAALGSLHRGMRIFGRVASSVGGIGTLMGFGLTALATASSGYSQPGWGAVWLAAGVIATTPLFHQRAQPLVNTGGNERRPHHADHPASSTPEA